VQTSVVLEPTTKKATMTTNVATSPAKTKVLFLSNNIDIAGILFTPGGDAEGPLPAVVIGHPGGGVKKQTASIYAERLAREGFANPAPRPRTRCTCSRAGRRPAMKKVVISATRGPRPGSTERETDMAWNNDQLERIGQAEELHVSSYRRDGTLRRWTPIWAVRVGDDLYVRSAFGPEGGWYRNAMRNQTARIRAGGVETDVGLELANDPATNAQVEETYESKVPRSTGRS
jgi:hypothetical protein